MTPLGSTSQILVRTSVGGFPIGPYLGDDALSAWIGPNNGSNLTAPVGTYDYRITFSLAGYDPSSASINGRWSTDNEGIGIQLNGGAIGNPNNDLSAFLSWKDFSITSGFVAGTNTLDFLINNSPFDTDGSIHQGDNPTALRVEMTGTAAAGEIGATPLPAALPLFAGGLGVLGLLAGRRKRKATAIVA